MIKITFKTQEQFDEFTDLLSKKDLAFNNPILTIDEPLAIVCDFKDILEIIPNC